MIIIFIVLVVAALGLTIYSLSSSAPSKPIKEIIPKKVDKNSSLLSNKLYSIEHIGIATFFGSPIAGIILMILNYRAKGMNQKVRDWTVIAIITAVFMLLLIYFFLDHPLMKIFPFASLFIMAVVAKQYHEPILTQHRQENGKEYSAWRAAGIGIIFCILLIGIILFFDYIQNPYKHTMTFGTKDEIIYTSTVTEDNAHRFGSILQKAGYFKDTGATVGLNKKDNTIIISFVLVKGAWNKQDIIDGFKKFGYALKQAVSKENNIEVHLCNSNFEIKRILKDF